MRAPAVAAWRAAGIWGHWPSAALGLMGSRLPKPTARKPTYLGLLRGECPETLVNKASPGTLPGDPLSTRVSAVPARKRPVYAGSSGGWLVDGRNMGALTVRRVRLDGQQAAARCWELSLPSACHPLERQHNDVRKENKQEHDGKLGDHERNDA